MRGWTCPFGLIFISTSLFIPASAPVSWKGMPGYWLPKVGLRSWAGMVGEVVCIRAGLDGLDGLEWLLDCDDVSY